MSTKPVSSASAVEKQKKPLRRKAIGLVVILACLGVAKLWADYEPRPLPKNAHADRILVEKSARRLTLLEHGQPLKTYHVSLGWHPEGHKQQQGDYRTPEGLYSIDWHKPNSICHRALHISYPNAADQAQAAARGVSPGGDIMVHGLPNGFGWMGAFHRIFNYTAGCVAVTDSQIEEIYRAVPDGTPIEIRP